MVGRWHGCLKRGALHIARLMPLPLTVSCFSKIQIVFTFLVLVHLGSLVKMAVNRVLLVTDIKDLWYSYKNRLLCTFDNRFCYSGTALHEN